MVSRKHVDFTLQDETPASTSSGFILAKHPVTPYTQWNENNGYCGELSSVQAGMASGQWMSQFNARQICGSGLSQSGSDGFCAANDADANYNAQFLFETPVAGDSPFASSPVCLANAHLAFQNFDYAKQSTGMAGYQEFMTWVKARVIAGDTVAIGVLNRGGDDPQYDHEVTIAKIGTNHGVTDASYYADDVLYFEDHGDGGAAYTKGYSFESLAQSRKSANSLRANTYSVLIPDGVPVHSGTGGDGAHPNSHAITPGDYGFAVAGPVDRGGVLLPVTVAITGSTSLGRTNAAKGSVGFNFESPEIGEESGSSCTNSPPTWMGVTLAASVTGLTPGIAYNLYEYDFNTLGGLGSLDALKIPDADFNALASEATSVTHFVADGPTYNQTVTTTSDQVVVFRCVRADAS